jgi:hypothetical protein
MQAGRPALQTKETGMALRQMIDEPAVADDETGSYPSAFAPVDVRREPALSAVERNVILLARHDTLGSLEAPGAIERAVAWLFGARGAARRLADPQLEALRRAVVVTRHRRHLPDPVAAELRTLGYGEQRIRTLETLALGA